MRGFSITVLLLSFILILTACSGGTAENSAPVDTSAAFTEMDFNKIIMMSKSEVLDTLGKDYIETDSKDVKGTYHGFSYRTYGIFIVFDPDDQILFIATNDKVSVKGTKPGQTLKEVIAQLGDTEIIEGWRVMKENKNYRAIYTIDDCKYVYETDNQDTGKVSLTVYRKDSTEIL